MKNNLELRMYGLVPYNISEIQKGIQFGHGVVEYAQKFFKDKDYQEWAKNHKTFIILNGGTTNNGFANNEQGTMQNHLEVLRKNKIKHSVFFEPDLNNALTSISFLVDERCFNYKKYPSFENCLTIPTMSAISKKEWLTLIGGKQNEIIRKLIGPLKLA